MMDERSYRETIGETLLEQMSDSVFVATPVGKFVLVNDQACRMLGYSREALLQLSIQDVIAPESLAASSIRFDELRAGKTIVAERILLQKDGTRLVVELSTKILTNGQLQGIARDITARKQIEDNLRRNDANMRAILDNSALSYVLMDADHRVITMNRAAQLGALAVFGKTIQVGDSFTDFLSDWNRDDFHRNFDRALRGEIVLSEQHVMTPQGQMRYIDFRYAPAVSTDGLVLGVCLSAQDTTEQKQAQRALQESEQKFRVLSEQSLIGISIMQDNKLKYVNQAVADIIGYTVEEMLGWEQIDFGRTVHPEDLAFAADQARKKQIGDPTAMARYPYRIIMKSGQIRWVEQFSNTIDYGGRPANLGVIIDITDRKRAEQELRKRDTILTAASTVTNFFLRATAWEQGVLDVLRILGEAAGVGRTGILQRQAGKDGVSSARLRYEWNLPVNMANSNDAQWHKIDSFERRLEPILDRLIHGRPEYFRMQTELAADPTSGEAAGAKAFLLLPILLQNAVWGVLYLSTTRDQSEWSKPELEALQIAADTLGTAMERQRVEELLAKERNLLRTVVDNLPDNIFAKDTEGRFLLNNAVSLKMLGVTRQEETLGKTDFDFWPRQIAEESRAHELTIIQSGQPVIDREEFQPWESGAWRWLVFSTIPLRDDRGAVIGLVGVTHDISERKRAEELLAKERVLLRTVLNIMPDNIFIKDLEGRFLLNNAVSLKMLGVSQQEDALGKTDFDFWPSDLAERSRADEIAVLKSGEPIIEEEIFQPWQTGAWRWLIFSTIPLRDEHGTLYGVLGMTRDISNLKRAEELLAKERNLLRTVIDILPDNIFVKDRESRFVLNNRASLTLLGASEQEDLIGKSDFDFFPHDLAEQWRVQEQSLIESGQPLIDVEEFQPWRGEKRRWTIGSTVPLRDEQGNVYGLLGFSRDISNLKRTEELLAKERNLLRTVIDILPDNIFVKDRESRFILNNKVSMGLLGVSRQEDVIGKSDFDFFPPETAGRWRDREQLIMKTGQAVRDKEVFEPWRVDSRRWVVVNTIPLADEQGEVYGLLGFSRDITERKKAEEQLRDANDLLEQRVIERTAELQASKQHVEAILHNSPEGILLLSPDFRIRQVNPAFEGLFACQPDEYTHKPLFDLFQGDVTRDLLGVVQSLAAEAPNQRLETRAQRKDGSVFDAELSIRSFPDGGLVCNVSDITVHKQAEETLQLALAAERELGELKMRFVSMASHEFRTPLAAIQATTETLIVYRHKLSEEQIAQKFIRIKEQVRHLTDIMDDVLQLARMQARRAEYNPTMLNLDQLCRSVIAEFQDRADIQHQLLYTVEGNVQEAMLDMKLMRQILSNLISNAIKYSPLDKPVTVRSVFTAEDVVLSVADQGIGIPESDKPHLFEPFHRASNVGVVSGTGLGLVITKDSVELHGGTISFASQIGVGTTFIVRLPLVTQNRSDPDLKFIT